MTFFLQYVALMIFAIYRNVVRNINVFIFIIINCLLYEMRNKINYNIYLFFVIIFVIKDYRVEENITQRWQVSCIPVELDYLLLFKRFLLITFVFLYKCNDIPSAWHSRKHADNFIIAVRLIYKTANLLVVS